MQASPPWPAKADLLSTLTGVGEVTTLTLLASLPEPGRLDRKQSAALVGLAPLNRDRGTARGRRRGGGGRALVRQARYLAALAAVRPNPLWKTCNTRLRQAAKKPKAALVAWMRKLLTIRNAMLRDQTPWNESHAQSA